MPRSSIDDRYDVIIAGARCAGASTAMLLARAGLKVLVVDPLPRGRDTLSTHALMRGGVMQLARWGLLDRVRAAGTPVIPTTTFHYGEEVVPIPIKQADGIDGLYAPRRTVLDPILADAAEEAGATVLHGVSVTGLLKGRGGRVRGAVLSGADVPERSVSARWVIGADGLRSRVARLVEAPLRRVLRDSAASIFGYWPGLPADGYHWHFGAGVAAGCIPTNDGHTCVFASLPAPRFVTGDPGSIRDVYHETIRAMSPELAEQLGAVGEDVRLRAFPGVPGFIRESVGPGWALTGDAGYFRDPITAHGISDALREAEFLALALLSDRPGAMATYQAERDGRVTGLLEVTDRIASFRWDMDEVKELHLALAREMNVGVEAIRGLDADASSDTPLTAIAATA